MNEELRLKYFQPENYIGSSISQDMIGLPVVWERQGAICIGVLRDISEEITPDTEVGVLLREVNGRNASSQLRMKTNILYKLV